MCFEISSVPGKSPVVSGRKPVRYRTCVDIARRACEMGTRPTPTFRHLVIHIDLTRLTDQCRHEVPRPGVPGPDSRLRFTTRLDATRRTVYSKSYRRVHSHIQAQGEVCFEAHVSTEPQTQVKDARLPDPDAHARRPQDPQPAAPEGPAPADSMNAGRRPYAFPKQLRLLRRNEFRRVYEEGKRRSASLCTVFFRSNGLAESRLGLTVPVAVGSAPLRNRLKRRVREVFRLNQATIPGGWDIVVNPRKGLARAPFDALTRELLRLFPAAPPVANAPSSAAPATREAKSPETPAPPRSGAT